MLDARPEAEDTAPNVATGVVAGPQSGSRRPWRLRAGSVEVIVVLVGLAILGRGWLAGLVSGPRGNGVATAFVSIVLGALPFLVAGTLVAAAIRSFVRPGLLGRWLRARGLLRRPVLAVPAATLAAVALPVGDEAVADATATLIRDGVPRGAAFAYALAAPAVSPVVLVATAVALPGQPLLVLARVLASLAVAVVVGLGWHRFGRSRWLERSAAASDEPGPDLLQPTPVGAGGVLAWLDGDNEADNDGTAPDRDAPAAAADQESGDARTGDGAAPAPGPDGWAGFWAYARMDLLRSGGLLVVGAFVTAVLTVAVPADWPLLVAARPVFSVVAVALLAVLLSVPAEAGPFLAAGLVPFSVTARLVFLVVGPAVNLRRFTEQSTVYGPAFVLRFAPATFVVAIAVGSLVARIA